MIAEGCGESGTAQHLRNQNGQNGTHCNLKRIERNAQHRSGPVSVDDAFGDVVSGDGQDNIRVKGRGGEDQKVDLDGGGGSDVYTVDVSTGTTVNINDQDGGRIHLTGDLKKNSNPTGNYDSAKQEASFTLTNSSLI